MNEDNFSRTKYLVPHLYSSSANVANWETSISSSRGWSRHKAMETVPLSEVQTIVWDLDLGIDGEGGQTGELEGAEARDNKIDGEKVTTWWSRDRSSLGCLHRAISIKRKGFSEFKQPCHCVI